VAAYTVPNNKLLIFTKEEGAQILKDARTMPLSPEERAAIKEKARKLRQKPEKINNGTSN